MRVWDCDPRLLTDKHLRAQHAEIHFAIRCLEGGWKTKWRDVERFRKHPRGLAWLGFVHEVTIKELKRRGRFKNHQTPVTTVYQEVLGVWCHGESDYIGTLDIFGYPRTELNQGTPWERDGVSFEWYRAHEKDWTRWRAELEAAHV